MGMSSVPMVCLVRRARWRAVRLVVAAEAERYVGDGKYDDVRTTRTNSRASHEGAKQRNE